MATNTNETRIKSRFGWLPRSSKDLIIIVTMLLIIASIYTFVTTFRHQLTLQSVARYNITWTLSRAPHEVSRLETAILVNLTRDNRDEVRLRLDLVLNRIQLFEGGDVNKFIRKSPELEAIYIDFRTTLAEIQPLIQVNTPTNMLLVYSKLEHLNGSLFRLATAGYIYSSNLVSFDLHELSYLHWLFSGMLIALVAWSFSLIIMMLRSNRLLKLAYKDRIEIEQQLVQSQKMEAIGQLTGGMAHDFNNILGVVIGNLDMLNEQFKIPPVELIESRNAALTGAELVRRLLAFARRQSLQPRLVHLDLLLNDMLPLLRRMIGGAIEIETIYETDGLLPVITDPTQLENVMFNLVINARDAMPQGGKLIIECKTLKLNNELSDEYGIPVGIYSTLIISDNGQGIPDEVLPHVFEPFFTTKPPGSGSGLGLSMVFGHIKQSGGAVRIYSEVGHGTSVFVYLPATADDGSASVSDEPVIDLADLRGNERILIVEDTANVREISYRILTSLGYTVRQASNAQEALAILAVETFDLLFTDIIMPGMDGIALAEQAKQNYPAMKILFASGFSAAPYAVIKRLDAKYLTKPYRKIELAQLLRTFFQKR